MSDYKMCCDSKVEGEGYEMNGDTSGKGGGMGFKMAGGGAESTKGETAEGSNAKGKMTEDRDK